MARTCDGCGGRQAPFFPRTNVDGEMLCNTCVSRRSTARIAAELHSLRYKAVNWSGNMPPSDRVFLIDQNIEPIYHLESGSHLWPRAEAEAAVGTQEQTWRSPAREIADPKDGWHPIWRAPAGQSGRWQMTNSAWGSDWDKLEGSRKVAHDSGDGETLYHCPFCGAGQLTGRSDGTAECGFCGTAFTVQVQPSLSAQPQTLDGEPVMMPDMPGVPGEDPGVPEEEIDADTEETELEGGEGEDNMDDFGQDPATPTNPFQPAKKSNPFQSKKKTSFKTSNGASLSEDDYIRHLAIRYAPDRDRVIAKVRGSRKG